MHYINSWLTYLLTYRPVLTLIQCHDGIFILTTQTHGDTGRIGVGSECSGRDISYQRCMTSLARVVRRIVPRRPGHHWVVTAYCACVYYATCAVIRAIIRRSARGRWMFRYGRLTAYGCVASRWVTSAFLKLDTQQQQQQQQRQLFLH